MHTLISEAETTTKVVICYDDGTSVEVMMTPVLARSIAKLDEEDAAAERKRKRARVKSATDLRVNPASWLETQRLVGRRSPRPGMILFGEGAIWGGPSAQWLRSDGHICKPGEDPITGKRNGQRCRFCGSVAEFPANATCLNDGCTRERK